MRKNEFIEDFNPFEYVNGEGTIDEMLRQFHDEFNEAVDELIESEIEAYEKSQWKAYPENKPEEEKRYINQDVNGRYWILQGKAIGVHNPKVIAFRELPPCYKK